MKDRQVFSGYNFSAMLKYLAALVVVFGLAFVVARQDQHGADQAAQTHKAAVATPPNEQHPKENIENPTGDSPRWYVLYLYSLFRWPSGTTTWAVILTLLAVAEQTAQTRRSVEMTSRSLILSHRPKLIVRAIKIDRIGSVPVIGAPKGDTTIVCGISNSGEGAAEIRDSRLSIVKLEPRPDGTYPLPTYPDDGYAFTKTVFKSGEFREELISISFNDGAIFRMLGTKRAGGEKYSGDYFCLGFVIYGDSIGTKRRTAFFRHYNANTGSFDRVKDSDYEYAD
jgi:hypothetical protein